MANPGTEMVFEALSCHETALRGNPAVSGFTTLHIACTGKLATVERLRLFYK